MAIGVTVVSHSVGGCEDLSARKMFMYFLLLSNGEKIREKGEETSFEFNSSGGTKGPEKSRKESKSVVVIGKIIYEASATRGLLSPAVSKGVRLITWRRQRK